jgi:hypothetical protein
VGTLDGVAGLNRRSIRLKPSSDVDCRGVGMPDLGGIVLQCSPVSAAGGGDSFSSRTRCLEGTAMVSRMERDVGSCACPDRHWLPQFGWLLQDPATDVIDCFAWDFQRIWCPQLQRLTDIHRFQMVTVAPIWLVSALVTWRSP